MRPSAAVPPDKLAYRCSRRSSGRCGWARRRLREHGKHVLERLLELRDQLLAMELLLVIPADLTGDEHDAARGDTDPVGVAGRRRPTGWM